MNIVLEEGNSTSFENALKEGMDQAIDHFKKELVAIRSGRAHTSMVADIKVSCYNGESELRLREIAALSTPDANLIVIEPWDKSLIADVEKAISHSDLGVNPINDGNLIRIQLPVMSAERREELVKILSKKTEDARKAIRAIRKDFHNLLREKEQKKTISEDFSKRVMDKLQKVTDQKIGTIDEMGKKKESELKTF
ncbi:TPA: ribosome recycling factor [Candidatus Dependentiae bacterium]|nr:MAG: Ribosome-recycling factor [candidate division TM6 bacterium GW2011_GWF2_36_131]KKQ02637.1 MAG: Ribosome-recycling factor [candidate division TM6 bacterium GW2011_GWE2_36_25]KKQ19229.1 MAG: Ribosome-recycling factor [candidate division TM6 bacterium GW2011_GWA2_36_9]HBR70269.1 ribosome recycling factor [Candidatus Dependentiae bacterium]HCU00959.1 ribosome recycling factor [Candidatus Dependentiae bacterium]